MNSIKPTAAVVAERKSILPNAHWKVGFNAFSWNCCNLNFHHSDIGCRIGGWESGCSGNATRRWNQGRRTVPASGASKQIERLQHLSCGVSAGAAGSYKTKASRKAKAQMGHEQTMRQVSPQREKSRQPQRTDILLEMSYTLNRMEILIDGFIKSSNSRRANFGIMRRTNVR